jgi:exopolyphosphatase / guanosine-5'-triphosphate,3'-diphosphate pyrophosphatase
MKLAAIDIGTNSIHMVIVNVEQHRIFEIIDREKEMVFLGKGSLLKRRLPQENIDRGLNALRAFKSIADTHHVDEIITTATSAVREAENGRQFMNLVKRETGIEIRLLSGVEEARMITLAVRDVIDLKDQRALIVDIGGGSMELIVADARHIYFAQSIKSGVIRLQERFMKEDPPTAKNIKALQKWLARKIEPLSRKIQDLNPDIFIGTSGTILHLGEMVRAARKNGKGKNILNIDELEMLNKKLQISSLEERLKFPGLDKNRAEQVVGGGILVEMVMERCRANELILCDRALREGLIADYLIRKVPSEPAKVQARELRSKSVINLLNRWDIDRKHAEHSSRLALQMFDAISPFHPYGAVERELLEYASLLHDIGRVISYPAHHKHGWYIIHHANLIGFQPEEIDMIAATIAYHRGKKPKKKDDYMARLSKKERRVVKFLTGILRVVDGLDRQHNQSITQVVARKESPRRLSVSLVAEEPAIVPLKAAIERCGLLQKAMKLKQIDFQVEDTSSAIRASAS